MIHFRPENSAAQIDYRAKLVGVFFRLCFFLTQFYFVSKDVTNGKSPVSFLFIFGLSFNVLLPYIDKNRNLV